MNQYVIAIDRGSTNVKAVVFDTKGNELLTSSYASQKPVSIKPGWWEQDMNMMWESTAKAIKGVFSKGVSPEEIIGIFVTGQGNGLMPLGKDGQPCRMGILSLDSRAADVHNGWMADGRYMQVAPRVGMPFPVGSPMPLLAWFKANSPEEYAAMDKVLFSKDWIRYKLSGVICTDPTDASGAGLMELAKGDYAYEVFDLLGIGDIKKKLPEIRPSHEVIGKVTREASLATGLKEGTAVLCGAHDIAAYPFGIGTLDSKQLVSVVGTWGFNIIPLQDPTGAPAALYHTVPGYFLAGIGDGNSGGCLDIMLANLCGNEKYQAEQQQLSVYEYVENMIADTKPTGILFHPFIFGSILNGAAGAGLYGVKNWHSKADIMRAVYEGIVMGHYAYMHAIPGMSEFTCLWLIGGGSKSKVFGQMFADVTGLTVRVPKSKEITARGGALNALVGLGIYPDHTAACIPPEVGCEYTPNLAMHEVYIKKFGVFCQLNESMKDTWAVLNELSTH